MAGVRSGRWDRIGIWLSGLCALHCLVVPVALALLPLWPVALRWHDWAHVAFAVLLVPVTLVAMWGAHRRERPWGIPFSLGLGLLLVLLAIAARASLGEVGETLVTLTGSILLITGHWRNWRGRATEAWH